MADRRIVQCFGIKKRPGKPARFCGRKFLWTARGASSGNFGSKGVQACPHCGTLPDLSHPYNRYLGGSISFDSAMSLIEEKEKELLAENKS